MNDIGPSFVRPTVGRIVHYFPADERGRPDGVMWAAIVTAVHERERDELGEEIGPYVVSLSAFPSEAGRPAVLRIAAVPLAGMYDADDLREHAEWRGCWNWPPRGLG